MQPLESLLQIFVELHPEDAARAFEQLPPEDALRLFQNLPVAVVVELLSRLSPHIAAPLLEALDSQRLGRVVAAMSLRAAAAVLHQLEPNQRGEVLAALPDKVAKPLRELVRYPADTAGGMMEPRVASLAIDLTAQEAIDKIRRAPRDALHYLYVTGRDGKLIGVLNMRDLMLADPRSKIAPMVNRGVLAISDTMSREEVISKMSERKFLALPVVDFEGRLIGVVKYDNLLRASQMEAFEDLQKIVGAGADERALSPVRTVIKGRLPWLYVNLLTAFMAAAVVGLFEGIIAQVAALAVLLPVVAGQGGNTGSQSLAVVMRGLALREIIPGTNRYVVLKEAVAGTINGLAVAVVTSAAVLAWRMAKGDPPSNAIGLALVIGLAMVVNMAAAAVAGAVIPLVLKIIGRDPAQSAAIFLTTVTDIVGFAAFLGFAKVFSSMLI